jgi:hypothetical protein
LVVCSAVVEEEASIMYA